MTGARRMGWQMELEPTPTRRMLPVDAGAVWDEHDVDAVADVDFLG